MRYHNRNIFNNATLEFPNWGFWMLHVLGIVTVFTFGLKLGWRKGIRLPAVAAELLRLFVFRH